MTYIYTLYQCMVNSMHIMLTNQEFVCQKTKLQQDGNFSLYFRSNLYKITGVERGYGS